MGQLEKSFTYTLIIISIIVIVGLVIADFAYFASYKMSSSTDNMLIVERVKKNERTEFEKVKQELFSSERYRNLKKYGNWPLDSESVSAGRIDPFNNISNRFEIKN